MDFYELELWKCIMHDINFKTLGSKSHFFVYKKQL